ncbi:lipopolysaccharide biosynthesis protein [Pedobacter sp. KR3-3]|uniref:Lipopolysaccharide biosynthesis protein n=1 Tax=Pedobacter albus TaxID=3113905 RepID=A0ABU7IC22_9SPHI|nr:lipopolysaccharide biosynthesis protein [Pedobacter sp. KR3-3]MEE1946841.1 lipopolysaccharide biosynthesis protein [Pedobacter sp. KR3-3]
MKIEEKEKKISSVEDIQIKDVLYKVVQWYRFLLSKWLIILIVALVGGTIGIVNAYFRKTTYIATTSFVLEEEKSGGGLSSLAGIASIAGVDIGGGGGIFQGDNILELYRSRIMITKALLSTDIFDGKKQLLIDRYIQANDLRKKWDKKPDLKNITFSDSANFTLKQDSLIGEIVKNINKENLKVGKPDKKLSIINVTVESNDEPFAKAFGNVIVKNVNDFYTETKIKKSRRNVGILQFQVDSVRKVMTGSIYSAAQIADATPNLNLTRQTQRIAPIQKSQFSAETNKIILGELLKNLELAKLSLRREEPLIQIIDKPILPLDNDRVSKTKAGLIGGMLGVFLCLIFLILRKNLKEIIGE